MGSVALAGTAGALRREPTLTTARLGVGDRGIGLVARAACSGRAIRAVAPLGVTQDPALWSPGVPSVKRAVTDGCRAFPGTTPRIRRGRRPRKRRGTHAYPAREPRVARRTAPRGRAWRWRRALARRRGREGSTSLSRGRCRPRRGLTIADVCYESHMVRPAKLHRTCG
jgi:hypothetical protein